MLALTTHCDVAVLPWCCGIHGVAPGTQAIVRVSAVVVLQVLAPIP